MRQVQPGAARDRTGDWHTYDIARAGTERSFLSLHGAPGPTRRVVLH